MRDLTALLSAEADSGGVLADRRQQEPRTISTGTIVAANAKG